MYLYLYKCYLIKLEQNYEGFADKNQLGKKFKNKECIYVLLRYSIEAKRLKLKIFSTKNVLLKQKKISSIILNLL